MKTTYGGYLIFENLQLAESKYFKTNLLDANEKEIILNITNSDNYTKIICDLAYFYKTHLNREVNDIENILNIFYKLLKEYNKNIFPMQDFDVYNKKDINILDLYDTFVYRDKMVDKLNNIYPSIAKRNMKDFIKSTIPIGLSANERYFNEFDYLSNFVVMVGNKPEKIRNKIYNKIFRSNYTISDMLNFTDDKKNLLSDKRITVKEIKNIVDENDYDLSIVYDENKVVVVEVSDILGIKDIGFNSLWCFTYGDNNYIDWNYYSYNGMVYVIFDFKKSQNDEYFMCVVIKPIDEEHINEYPEVYDVEEDDNNSPIYNMLNEPVVNYKEYLKRVFNDVDYIEFINFGL